MPQDLDPSQHLDIITRVKSREVSTTPLPEGPFLHLGCGLNTPPGWTHVDGSWNAWFSKFPFLRRWLSLVGVLPKTQSDISWNPHIIVRNITKGLPFPSDSYSAIYASHLLEHLYLEQQKILMEDIFRVLKPGGVFRAVVPDLDAIVREYLGEFAFASSEQMKAETRADRLNMRLCMRESSPPKGSWLYRIYRAFNDLHSHKWMYDAESLAKSFENAGFTRVQAMPLHVSVIPNIQSIEQPGRVAGGEGIVVEGLKPHWN